MLRPCIQNSLAVSSPFICLRCRLKHSNHGLHRHSSRVSALERVYLSDARPELVSPFPKKKKDHKASQQGDVNPQITRDPTAVRSSKHSRPLPGLVRRHTSDSTLPTFRSVAATTSRDVKSPQASRPDRRTAVQVRHAVQVKQAAQVQAPAQARLAAQVLHTARMKQSPNLDRAVRKIAGKVELVKKVKGGDLVKRIKSGKEAAKKARVPVSRHGKTQKTRPPKVNAADKKTDETSAIEEFSDGTTSSDMADTLTARPPVEKMSRSHARSMSPQEGKTSLNDVVRANEESVEPSTLCLEGEWNKCDDHNKLLTAQSNHNRTATSPFIGLRPRSSPIQVGNRSLYCSIVVTDTIAKPRCTSSPRPSLPHL